MTRNFGPLSLFSPPLTPLVLRAGKGRAKIQKRGKRKLGRSSTQEPHFSPSLPLIRSKYFLTPTPLNENFVLVSTFAVFQHLHVCKIFSEFVAKVLECYEIAQIVRGNVVTSFLGTLLPPLPPLAIPPSSFRRAFVRSAAGKRSSDE